MLLSAVAGQREEASLNPEDRKLLKGNNCPSEQVRKRNTITKLLATADLQIEDDYSKFHDTFVIDAI